MFQNDLENSQTWDFVEPPAELEKSTLMIVEEEEPGPGLLSRAVGGVVSLFTWGSAASMSALEATSLGEFSVVHANWYGRRYIFHIFLTLFTTSDCRGTFDFVKKYFFALTQTLAKLGKEETVRD